MGIEDIYAVICDKSGKELSIGENEEINIKDIPNQSETFSIIISGSYGFDFYAKGDGDVKFYVTYDENGLIDGYRLDGWNSKPYEGETEISFESLQNEKDYEKIDRSDIPGTMEYDRKYKI
jgi:hypothetical protein